jgi:hypothetical protein
MYADHISNSKLARLTAEKKNRNFPSTEPDNTVLRVKTHPLKPHYRDGTVVCLWLPTVRQEPMSIPGRYAFALDEISTADTVQRKFNLDISMHYWFWDMFVFRKNFNRNARQALQLRRTTLMLCNYIDAG